MTTAAGNQVHNIILKLLLNHGWIKLINLIIHSNKRYDDDIAAGLFKIIIIIRRLQTVYIAGHLQLISRHVIMLLILRI